MTQKEYIEKALEFLNKIYPELGVKKCAEELALELKDNQRIFLHTPYIDSKNNDFREWEKELERFFKTIRESLVFVKELTPEEARLKILPQIKSLFEIEYSQKLLENIPTEENIFFDDFLDDLKIMYVIDDEKTYTYLTLKELKRLGISREEVKMIALENLEKLPRNRKIKQVPLKDGSFAFIWETNDGYDAPRILLPNLWQTLETMLGKEFIVAIPHRDLLIAAKLEFFKNLKELAVKKFKKSSRPITDKLIKVSGTGLSIET